MFSALAMVLAQANDPAFRRVFFVTLAWSFLVFLGLWALAWFGLAWVGEALSAWVAAQEPGSFWVRTVAWVFGAASLVAVLVASFLLFPAVVAALMPAFLENIAAAVERRHYPELPPPRARPIGEELVAGLVFAGVSVGINLLAIPLYLALFLVPPINLFVFYILNGYLLGREYFELVAGRRVDPSTARRLRRRHRTRVFLAGVVIAFLLTAPLVNLVMPILAAGFMVHVFERLRRSTPGSEGTCSVTSVVTRT